MKYANTYRLRRKLAKEINEKFQNQVSYIEVNRLLKNSKIKKAK